MGPGHEPMPARVLDGRYALGRALGTGASGTVYAADDLDLGRHVAVKVLHEALAGDPVFVERLGVEARTVGGLQHPSILTVYDWGVDGSAYLVTEYLAGGSLRSLLDTGRTLSHSQALVIGLEVCKALDHAHQMGVVHRDLKPANLLFSQDGHLKVSDFGLAGALAETSRTDIFVEGIVGTARFASPEQAKGQPLDGRSDVYALALVLVEAVTGHLPFVEDTLLGTLRARRRRDVPVPASMGPLGPAVARAGSVDLANRPTAAEFGRLLLEAAPALARPEPLPLVGPGEIGAAPLSGEVPLVPKSRPPEEPKPSPRPAGGSSPAMSAGTEPTRARSSPPSRGSAPNSPRTAPSCWSCRSDPPGSRSRPASSATPWPRRPGCSSRPASRSAPSPRRTTRRWRPAWCSRCSPSPRSSPPGAAST